MPKNPTKEAIEQTTPKVDAPAPKPATGNNQLYAHEYRPNDFVGGHVIPRKPYALPLPTGIPAPIAAFVTVVSAEDAATTGMYATTSIIRDGKLHVELEGRGAANGIAVIFVLPPAA